MTDTWTPWDSGVPYGVAGVSPAFEIVSHEGEIVIHPPQQFVAGDTWQIMATCLNADGSLMDLAGAAINWVLNDSTGQAHVYIVATPANGGVVVAPPDANNQPTGVCYIVVTPQQSAQLAPGFYMDQLRVQTTDGVASTVFQGRIEVVACLPLSVQQNGNAVLQGIGTLGGH